MRSACFALIFLAAAATAYAQSTSSTTTTGNFGPWQTCNRLCDGGITWRNCLQAGQCTVDGQANDHETGVCNTEPCKNCTVSALSWYTPCTQLCNGGTQWRARTIIQQPDLQHGGAPCPQLNFTYTCNTQFCMETMPQYGYFFWGPFSGPGPITFNIIAIDETLDVYIFDQADFLQYQFDVQRTKPFQTGYGPVFSKLNVANTNGVVQLQNTQYYFVVDNTLTGGATGTANNNGQITFPSDRFYYKIEGVAITGNGQFVSPVMYSAASATATPAVAVLALAAAAIYAAL
jgi:hypothetical protein